MNASAPVLWNDRLVGHVRPLRHDFPHVYGPWHPLDGPDTEAFLDALRQHGDDPGVHAVIGGVEVIVYAPPDDHDGELEGRLRSLR